MNAPGGLLLTVNAGSSSLKLAAFHWHEPATREAVLRITLDRHAAGGATVTGAPELVASLAIPAAHDAAFVPDLIGQIDVRAVAHRIVHGGDETRECVPLDPTQCERLHALVPLAPLHQPPALAIVDAIATRRPGIRQYACFDTAFHATLPALAHTYALPAGIRARHPELRVRGFHGISCRSIVDRLTVEGILPSRLVIAHLGSGASVTAVQDGRSIATSMGFSALDGLPMATRPGRLDAGALLYLLRHETPAVDALEEMLYRESGLLGLSGCSGDMRTLLATDTADARAAVEFFIYRAAQEIAALAVALDGIDTLVFTGGIGEHQPVVRDRIVERLRCIAGNAQVRVMPCDEEAAMATAVRGQH